MKRVDMIHRTASLLALCLGLSACGDSTTGRTVVLHNEVVLDAPLGTELQTHTGWSVSLSAAAVSLRALYYFDGEPAFVQRRAPSLWRQLASWIGPSVAYAHPGHYQQGLARGQLLESAALALHDEPSALGVGNGISGRVRSGRVVFAASDRSEPELAGDVAYLRGSASKGDKTVHFVLSASFEDVARNAGNGAVNGCVFEETDVQDDGTVTLQVKPQVWLNLVRFDDLDPGSEEAPTKVVTGDDAQVAFAVGVAQLSAYQFSYRAEL
jgi:hypothetical protein